MGVLESLKPSVKEIVVFVTIVVGGMTSYTLHSAKVDTILASDIEQKVAIKEVKQEDITQNLTIQSIKSDLRSIKESVERVEEDVSELSEEISGLRDDIRAGYLVPMPTVVTKSEQNGASRIETL
jgi:peptidoglycan hydrolase CwlO-like protein